MQHKRFLVDGARYSLKAQPLSSGQKEGKSSHYNYNIIRALAINERYTEPRGKSWAGLLVYERMEKARLCRM